VKGIADAAEALGTPVISGNVSFYNESDLGEVPPTPLIGMLGILDDAGSYLPSAPRAGDLYLLSIPGVEIEQEGLGASAFVAYVHDLEDGYPVAPNLEGERRLALALAEMAASEVAASAHDLSEGGLAVALAEIAVQSGHTVHARADGAGPGALFGEIPGRVVVGAQEGAAVEAIAGKYGLRAERIGRVVEAAGRPMLEIELEGRPMSWGVDELRDAYEGAIPHAMAEA
jgi:phosphoribosylformylglycinamidine synthase